jgi:hypothetical protein
LTASDGDLSTALGSDGVITVIGESVTDEFGGHGTFDGELLLISPSPQFADKTLHPSYMERIL